MKKIVLIVISLFSIFVISLFSIFVISCSEVNNPVLEEEKIIPADGCSIVGVDLNFVDSCSYNFVISFLSKYDSITVIDTYLGSNFYIYADSGDYNSWTEFFKDDSTIKYIFRDNQDSDSLFLRFVLTGEKSIQEEKERFEKIDHLEIIKVEEHPKLVSIDVPENTESEWEKYFEQYEFIEEAYVVAICVEN